MMSLLAKGDDDMVDYGLIYSLQPERSFPHKSIYTMSEDFHPEVQTMYLSFF